MVSKAVKIGIAVTAGVVTLTIIIVISVLAAPARDVSGRKKARNPGSGSGFFTTRARPEPDF